jgi:hypothetical protein
MTAIPPIFMTWNGSAMEPLDRFSRLAEQSFASGHAYRMIVQEEEDRRTSEQNKKMWAMLTEVSQQKEHCGRRYNPDQWKVIFMHAWGMKVQFLPSLDNSTFVPYGTSSSKLSKKDMTELIEFILAWGTQNGVVFADDPVNHEQTG